MPLGKNAEKFKKSLSTSQPTESKEASNDFDIAKLRNVVERTFADWLKPYATTQAVQVDSTVVNTANNRKVKADIYRPTAMIDQPLPAIIFHPGGGLCLDMQTHHRLICAEMAKNANAVVICLQPQLSPELKFPEIYADAYDATKYFYQNADRYSIDATHFFISGYSMGGTLAALITLNSTDDKAELNVTGQIIISGVFRLGQPPLEAKEDFMFDPATHIQFVQLCLPESETVDSIKRNPSYNPLIHPALPHLPPTHLITGSGDAFKADSEAFATAIQIKGGEASVDVLDGQIHNSSLLFPLMGDGESPAKKVGEYVTKCLTPSPQCKA